MVSKIAGDPHMKRTHEIIEMAKKALKRKGLTYADVAIHLALSEISVKRMFAQQHISVARLEAVCAMMELDFTDLVRMADQEHLRISNLTHEQEEELISDLRFLLVAMCVKNSWTYEEIIDHYRVSEPECIGYLARLDRLGLIQLLANNRIRTLVARNFRWLPRGPIEKSFEQHVQQSFLKSHFSRPDELRLFATGMLSLASLEAIKGKVEILAREFADLRREDAKLTASARVNTGFMTAIRPWELTVFAKLKQRAE